MFIYATLVIINWNLISWKQVSKSMRQLQLIDAHVLPLATLYSVLPSDIMLESKQLQHGLQQVWNLWDSPYSGAFVHCHAQV